MFICLLMFIRGKIYDENSKRTCVSENVLFSPVVVERKLLRQLHILKKVHKVIAYFIFLGLKAQESKSQITFWLVKERPEIQVN